jgi:hypothetical protein
MSRSSNLRAGRPKFLFGLAGTVGPLRLIEPRRHSIALRQCHLARTLMRLPCGCNARHRTANPALEHDGRRPHPCRNYGETVRYQRAPEPSGFGSLKITEAPVAFVTLPATVAQVAGNRFVALSM